MSIISDSTQQKGVVFAEDGTPIGIFVSSPTVPVAEKLTKEDVWGAYDEDYNLVNKGMIVAKSDEICPVWHDRIPYKSVTVMCKPEQYNEVVYWLEYVHGANSVSNCIILFGDMFIRSNYMCW